MLDINITDRRTLIDLLEDCTSISESPGRKDDVHCEALLERDGKLYIIEYIRTNYDGILEDTAEIYEVTARQVTSTVYDRVPDPTPVRAPVPFFEDAWPDTGP